MKQANGEWIQFLDSDDAIAADKIESQMKYARTAGHGRVGDLLLMATMFIWKTGASVPAGPINILRYEDKHPLMFCMYYASLHHGACLMRRSALERVRGSDENHAQL